MPTNQQRRDAAKRKLERQLVRRQERARSRRNRNIIAGAVVGVLVVAGAIFLLTRKSTTDTTATGSDASTTSSAAPTTPCVYGTAAQASVKAVSAPANTNPLTEGTVTGTIALGQGSLGFTLDRAEAPCAVNAFVSLASQKFYDGTSCHRLTTDADFKILQCGDPSGTGRGGPGFEYDNESAHAGQEATSPDTGTTGADATSTDSTGTDATSTDGSSTDTASPTTAVTGGDPAATESASDAGTTDTSPAAAPVTAQRFPVGTIAMAASAPDAKNGSQFFIVYGNTTMDSTGYTKIGTVDAAGLAVIEQIAAKGSIVGKNGTADAPAETVNITAVTVPADAVTEEAPPTTSDSLGTDLTDVAPTDTVPTDAVPTDAVPTDAVPTDSAATDGSTPDTSETDIGATDTGATTTQ